MPCMEADEMALVQYMQTHTAPLSGHCRVILSARTWKGEDLADDTAPYGPGGNIYRYGELYSTLCNCAG